MTLHPDTDGERWSALPDARRELLRRLLAERGRDRIPHRSSRESIAPASHGQRRLWFLTELDPASPLYQISQAHRIAGPLDPDVMRRSVREIVRRHEVLRTTFALRDGEPVQVISDTDDASWQYVDLSHLPHGEREARGHALASADAQAPFHLRTGPLMRVTLVRLEPAAHVLLLTLHHIVADGWSMEVLLRDLDLVYEAFARGEPSPLSPLPIQYADYAVWQRARLTDAAVAPALSYWTRQLSGTPRLALPADARPVGPRTQKGAREFFSIDAYALRRLDGLARRANGTLFMVLLAAFKVLLSRYSGEDDIVVGAPVSGRTQAETEDLVGFFLNTVCLRTTLEGNPTFTELLARVRRTTVDAFAHQDVPYDLVLEAVAGDRRVDERSVFDVMFVLQTTPRGREAAATAGSPTVEWQMESGTAKFDLTLSVAETSAGLVGAFEYATDRFRPATARRLVSHFTQLLASAAADTDARIAALDMLRPDEREMMLSVWNATTAPYPEDSYVHELIAARAAEHPDRVAVMWRDGQMTYRDLETRANQLAHLLAARAAFPEDRVALALDKSPDLLVAILAVWKAGCAYVPLDPSAPRARNEALQHDAGVRLTIDGEFPWDQLSSQPSSPPAGRVGPRQLAYIIYTSGSTGAPKGVMVEHRGLVNYLTWINDGPLKAPPDLVPATSRVTFDAALKQLIAPLVAGRTVWLVSDSVVADPDELLAELSRRGDFTLNCVPWMWTVLLDRLEAAGPYPAERHLKRLLLGGEEVSAALVERTFARLPGIELWNLYGPTETTVNATAARLRPGHPVTIGTPISNMGALILDRHGALVPVGVTGELHIYGVGLARGYWGRPDLTAERFNTNPLLALRTYRSGDLARYTESGAIEFLGRADGQVKVRGFRIEPREIEALLERHPAVRHAAVVAAGAPAARRLIAYVERRAAPAVTSHELRALVAETLPHYMVPSEIVLKDRLPRTQHDKIDRRSLASLDAEPPEPVAPPKPPSDDERRMAQIWTSILGVSTIHAGASFFELGGHSLLLAQLTARVADAFGVEVSLRDLFAEPTLEGCARAVARARDRGALARQPIRRLERTARRPQAGDSGEPDHDTGEPT